MDVKDPSMAEWLARIAKSFEEFAQLECRSEPLYFALCQIAARTPQIMTLLREAAPEQQRPNLLLAAIHFLVLSEAARHPIATYFPDIGGDRAVDDQLPDAFADFCLLWNARLRDLIATRTTQTNEIGRCAVLLPILHLIAERQRPRSIALLDFGCSAGLNLGVDEYQYDYGSGPPPNADRNIPVIKCEWRGSARPKPCPDWGAGVRIVEKLGIDVAPLRVDEEVDTRWLTACVWPHDQTRRDRLVQAMGMARLKRWKVEQHADCGAALEEWVSGLPGDVAAVVFNSWVLTYLSHDALTSHVQRMHALIQRNNATWVSAEHPNVRVNDDAPPAVPDGSSGEIAEATVWAVSTRGDGRPLTKMIARSHPHGKWAEWIAQGGTVAR